MVLCAMDEAPLVRIAAAVLMKTHAASTRGLLEVALSLQHWPSAFKLLIDGPVVLVVRRRTCTLVLSSLQGKHRPDGLPVFTIL